MYQSNKSKIVEQYRILRKKLNKPVPLLLGKYVIYVRLQYSKTVLYLTSNGIGIYLL